MSRMEIRLSDGPVLIDPAEWPEIASGTGDSWGPGGDPQRHWQAEKNGELDCYTVTVRQHEDGRVLVYAERGGAPAWTGNGDAYAGELLDSPGHASLVAAIWRIGQEAEVPSRVIREAIAGLPPREI